MCCLTLKINELIINHSDISHPCQTRLSKTFSKRIHTSEAPVTCKEAPEMYHAEEQPQPDGTDHEHERVPHDAERGLGNVKRQRVGMRVETAVGPDEPGGAAEPMRKEEPREAKCMNQSGLGTVLQLWPEPNNTTVAMVYENGTATAMARDLRARLALARLSSRFVVIVVVGLAGNGMVLVWDSVRDPEVINKGN